MQKLLSKLKRKGLRLATLFESAWLYTGRDDDFNIVTVWVCDDSI